MAYTETDITDGLTVLDKILAIKAGREFAKAARLDALPELPKGLWWVEKRPKKVYEVHTASGDGVTTRCVGRVLRTNKLRWCLMIEIEDKMESIFLDIPGCDYETAARMLAESFGCLIRKEA